uniref:AsparaginetRNA ligase cytoplasmic 1-like n=1 Tax=Rhizophora mucronata TaxID=61149 RepID=A0A2P2KAG7_RHIMU
MQKYHRSALPGYLGKGMTSLILSMPVAKSIIRSKPKPNPQCFTVPNRRRSRYHSYGSMGSPISPILQI